MSRILVVGSGVVREFGIVEFGILEQTRRLSFRRICHLVPFGHSQSSGPPCKFKVGHIFNARLLTRDMVFL